LGAALNAPRGTLLYVPKSKIGPKRGVGGGARKKGGERGVVGRSRWGARKKSGKRSETAFQLEKMGTPEGVWVKTKARHNDQFVKRRKRKELYRNPKEGTNGGSRKQTLTYKKRKKGEQQRRPGRLKKKNPAPRKQKRGNQPRLLTYEKNLQITTGTQMVMGMDIRPSAKIGRKEQFVVSGGVQKVVGDRKRQTKGSPPAPSEERHRDGPIVADALFWERTLTGQTVGEPKPRKENKSHKKEIGQPKPPIKQHAT